MTQEFRDKKIKEHMTNCRHFNGIQHDRCKAEVVYKDLFGDRPGWAAHLCCLADPRCTVTCDKFSPMSREEAEQEYAKFEERTQRFAKALHAAKDDAKLHGFKKGNGGYGSVKCPNCESGEIRYSVASYNGHMHAACTTKGCCSWME